MRPLEVITPVLVLTPTMPFSVGNAASDCITDGCITDVDMSVRGLLVIGTDGEDAATVGPPAMPVKKGGNVGPV